MTTRILATLCALTASGTVLLAAAPTYDFELLSIGTLADQDGWVKESGAVGDIEVTDGTDTNTTKVVTGTGVIPTAHRVNDAAFSFPSLTGFERNAIFQVDVQPANNHSVCGAYFTPGLSQSPSSLTILGPMFGCEENSDYGDTGFYLSEAAYDGYDSVNQYSSGPGTVQ